MQPEEKDVAYLWDMLDAAKTVCDFTKNINYHQYENDRKMQLAVERAVEIIGEAARRVSKDFQKTHSEIPWKGIIGQRHILAHEYGEIKQERMWILVSKRIPELIKLLEPLIPNEPNTD
ncbi:MAG: HepT-like ribonuclease domain-containing protein [Pseudomonadota bacterium]